MIIYNRFLKKMQNFLNQFSPEEKKILEVPTQKQKLNEQELKEVRLKNLLKARLAKTGHKEFTKNEINALTTGVIKKENKKRKTKTEINSSWTRLHKFISIDPPTELKGEKYRYSVSFRYYDPADGKQKKKSIKFGSHDKEYLIHHKDDIKNKNMLGKMKAYYCPFHKNFWVVSLLCSDIFLSKAYTKLLNNVL